MSILFRVRDADINRWVVKADEDIGPTAQHKKDATIFEGEGWLNYWQEAKGIEIVPLTETELMEHYAQTGLNLEPPTRYNIKNGDVWLVRCKLARLAALGNSAPSSATSSTPGSQDLEPDPARLPP